MATYAKIQVWVKKEYGWQPKTCWIAHCKELKGLKTEKSSQPKRRKKTSMPGKQTRVDLFRIPGIRHDLTLFCKKQEMPEGVVSLHKEMSPSMKDRAHS